MTRLALVTPHEVAVANVLRRQAWRWLTLDDVVKAARQYHRVPRRSVRLRLSGLVRDGLVDYEEYLYAEGDPYPWGAPDWWRWSAQPAPRLAGFEAACQVEGLLLEPIAGAPTHCAHGHALTDDDFVFPDGWRRCGVCWGNR